MTSTLFDSINDFLYDDLLILIFQYLDYETRVSCRSVCQRWLSILMTDFKFRKDRKLYLSNCSIHPSFDPAKVLIRSEFSYETLVISKSALKWLSYETHALPFFKSLGETITSMRLVDFGVDKETCEIFQAFPKLRKLKMDGYETFFKVKDLMEMNLMNLFPNLETLKVRNLLSIDRINDLMSVLPKLKSLNFTNFAHLESRHYNNMIKFNKEQPGVLHGAYIPMFQENRDDGRQKSAVIDCIKSNPNIRRIIHTLQVPSRFDCVVDVLKEKEIAELYLYCVELPPVTLTNLTVLELKLLSNEAQPSISTLESLTNLKTLDLEVKEARCCFGHTPLLLSKVRTFKLSVWNSNCDECYHAISKSFTFLQEFHLITLCNATPRHQINRFFISWRILTKLSVRHATNCVGIPLSNELVATSNVCFRLKHLSLGNNIVINSDAIQKLCVICPNLLTLKFYVESTSPPIDKVMEELLSKLKKLTTLLIHPSEVSFYSVTEEEASLLFSIIIKHGKKLRNLTIPTHYKTNHTHAMKLLFEKLEYLSFVQLKEMDSRRYGYVMSRVKYLEITKKI